MTFGEKLQKHRKECGLTQTELAARIGISKNTVINYENGRTYPTDRSIYKKLAEVLGVNADYLHNENDDFLASVQESYGRRGARQAEELIQDFSALFAGGDLSDSDKDAVMRAIQDIYWDCKAENVRKYTPRKYRDTP